MNGARHFELDTSGRVTEAQAANWSEAYGYDTLGNQVHASWPAMAPGQEATGDRTYAGTRLLTAGRVRYEHDAAGRVTLRQKRHLSGGSATWRYAWDTENRLTEVSTPDGATWGYQYDPLGRRIAKRRLASDGETVTERVDFVWDGTNLAEQTTDFPGAGGPAVTPTWDHDHRTPLAQTERKTVSAVNGDTPQEEFDSRFFAIVTDLVGTPTELVDESGVVAWRSQSTLWGITAWKSDASAHTPLRFPGQYHDPETGLHHNYFRYYDPESARFLSPDPLGLEPGTNPSAYVSNPHTWTDPLGLSPYPADPIKLYRSPHAGNRSLEANGLDPSLHPDTPEGGAGTAYLGETEEVAQKYADQGIYEDGYHEYVMKPEFRDAFPENATPSYRRTHDNKPDEFQWLIPREEIPKFNSMIQEVNWVNYYGGIAWRD